MTREWIESMVKRDELGRFAEHASAWLARAASDFVARHPADWGRVDPEMGRRWDRGRIPAAAARGFIRVGDHPTGQGRPETSTEDFIKTFGVSSHPLAGGVWIDPARPGTRHAPNFHNDAGIGMSGLRVPDSRSRTVKMGRIDAKVARFPEDQYGDTVRITTTSRALQVREGPLGSRGSRETDWRVRAEAQMRRRLRRSAGQKKRARLASKPGQQASWFE